MVEIGGKYTKHKIKCQAVPNCTANATRCSVQIIGNDRLTTLFLIASGIPASREE